MEGDHSLEQMKLLGGASYIVSCSVASSLKKIWWGSKGWSKATIYDFDIEPAKLLILNQVLTKI